MRSTAIVRIGILTALLVVYAACGANAGGALPAKALEILDKPDSVELYSLEPDPPEGKKPEKSLHGWPVLGSVVLKDAKVRDGAIAALRAGAGLGHGAKCFEPRHAIRAKRGGKTVDVLVCFGCGWIYVYYDGDKEESAVLSTDRGALPEFEKILKKAGVPLSKPPEAGDE
jgi:hypothetical protein